MATVVEVMTRKLIASRGVEHRARYLDMKRYLAEISDDEFGRQVKEITDSQVLQYLLYLGLPRDRQTIIAKWGLKEL